MFRLRNFRTGKAKRALPTKKNTFLCLQAKKQKKKENENKGKKTQTETRKRKTNNKIAAKTQKYSSLFW